MGLLSKVQSIAPPLPSRLVLYASEGFGKSSLGAFSTKPIFLMSQGETGLLSLLESGQVPPTAYLPECTGWSQMEDAVRGLLDEKHEYRTLVIDTANGACDMLAEEVKRTSFNNSQTDFNDYGKGQIQVRARWGAFLKSLDSLRVSRKVTIILLNHTKVKTFSDPAGKDYDQYIPDGNPKCWELTRQWADIIAYGGLKVQVSRDDKAYGDAKRYLRVESTPSIVAKNRYGLPPEIFPRGTGAKAMWEAFSSAVKAAKMNGHVQNTPRHSEPVPASAQAATPEPVRQPDPEPERQPGQWGNEADTGPYDHDVETERGDDLDFQTDERVEFLVELAGKCEMTTQSLPWAEILGQEGLTGIDIRKLRDGEYDAVYHWLDATYTRLHPRKAAKEKAGTT